MEAGGRVGCVEDERNRDVTDVAEAEEVVGGEGVVGESTMSTGALRSISVDPPSSAQQSSGQPASAWSSRNRRI
jgi:hypothetical protein